MIIFLIIFYKVFMLKNKRILPTIYLMKTIHIQLKISPNYYLPYKRLKFAMAKIIG